MGATARGRNGGAGWGWGIIPAECGDPAQPPDPGPAAAITVTAKGSDSRAPPGWAGVAGRVEGLSNLNERFTVDSPCGQLEAATLEWKHSEDPEAVLKSRHLSDIGPAGSDADMTNVSGVTVTTVTSVIVVLPT